MRLWRVAAAVLALGLAGMSPPAAHAACPAGLAASPARQALCDSAEFKPAWDALARLETPKSGQDRAAFDVRVSRCVDPKTALSGAALRQARTCVRERLWARVRALARAADPESPVGFYAWRDGESYGELRILPQSDGRPRIDLATQMAPSRHSCAVTLTRAWSTRRELAWKGELEPGLPASMCEFAFQRTGPDEIRIVSDQKCAWICGAQGDYRGVFRARP